MEYFTSPDLRAHVGAVTTIAGQVKNVKRGHAQLLLESGYVLDVPDALFVPDSNRNLLSFRALRKNGCDIATARSPNDSEHIKVVKDGTVLATFHDSGNGLYLGKVMAVRRPIFAFNVVAGRDNATDQIMHHRLGHPGQQMSAKLHNATTGGLPEWTGRTPPGHVGQCEACTLGKFQTGEFAYVANKQVPEFLSELSVDLHGPVSPTSGPFRYFMVIICRGTRMCHVYLLVTKDMVMAQMVKHIVKMRTQYPERRIKKIRFDNAQEFVSESMRRFLEAQGIEHETCVEYNHAQNGSAEAQIKRLQQVARTLLMGSRLPASAWGHAVLHANAILQLWPVLGMKESPKELLEGVKPSISHLRVFGCAVYVPIPPSKRTKLGPQRMLGIYVGYESPSIIRYLDPKTGQMFRARLADCVFDELVFPCLGEMTEQRGQTSGGDLEPRKDWLFLPRDGPPVSTRAPDAGRVESFVRETIELTNIAEKAPDLMAPVQGVTRAIGIGSEVMNAPATIDVGSAPAKIVEARKRPGRPLGSKNKQGSKRRKLTGAAHGHEITTPSQEDGATDIASSWTGTAAPIELGESNHSSASGVITDEAVPSTMSEARQSVAWPYWQKGRDSELSSLISRKVLGNVVELPHGAQALGHRWVFALKRNAQGDIVRHKVCLVAKGYAQRYGIDYDETYAPVMDATAYRYLLALAAHYDLETETMDVVTAYLYGDLDRTIYMDAPEGYQDEMRATLRRPVVRLQKALYGLKQSGRMWYQRLTTFLEKQGFVYDMSNPCIYVLRDETGFVIIAIYVDDLNLIGTSEAVSKAKKMLSKEFEMKDLGKLSHCLGLQVEHLPSGIFVHQSTYVKNVLTKYNMAMSNNLPTPMEVRGERGLYDDAKEGEALLDGSTPYMNAIGELMWLANRTRPDIAYAVNVLARHASKPTHRHWAGVKRIMRYLKGTADYCILYQKGGSNPSSPELMGCADAGYKSDPRSGMSQGGYVFKVGGAAISWKSRKQKMVATSTAHAELIALYDGAREAVSLSRLTGFLERSTGLRDLTQPIPLHEDNEACIKQVQKGYIRTDDVKHIDPKYYAWIAQEDGKTVKVTSIPSKGNTADLMTKALPPVVHTRHVQGLGLISLSDA